MGIEKINDEPKLSAFPEEVDENGLKIYGETSYENQIAALSYYSEMPFGYFNYFFKFLMNKELSFKYSS